MIDKAVTMLREKNWPAFEGGGCNYVAAVHSGICDERDSG